MASPIRVVLFDAGGTLIRPRRPVGETYARLAANYGLLLDARAVHEGFKRAFKNRENRREVIPVPTNGDDRPWWKLIVNDSLAGLDVPEHFPFDAYFDEVYDTFARQDLWMPFPECEEVLDGLLAQGLRLGVLSNWDARLHPVLEGLGLLGRFEHVLVSAHLGVEKPDTAAYRVAAERFGVAPEECLMVGDEPHNDYWAPRQAGLQAVLVDRPRIDLTEVPAWLQTAQRQ